MCGLAGAYSRYLADYELEAFQNLMTCMTFRGRHGSGFASVPQNPEKPVMVRKSAMPGSQFVFSKDFKDATKTNTTVLLGHCRYPTSGHGTGKNLENVHPHAEGGIVGTHNGTLDIVNGVFVKQNDSDSSLLFRAMNKVGAAGAISSSRGSMALVWLDMKEKLLRFYRNVHRPLYLGFPTDAPGTLYWSSEPEPLSWIIKREHHSTPTLTLLPPDNIWSYKYEKGEVSVYSKIHVTSMPDKPAAKPVSDIISTLQGATSSVPLLPAPAIPEEVKNEDDFGQFTLFNQKIPYFELKKKLDAGCCWCKTPVPLSDHMNNMLWWGSKDLFACDDCYKSDKTVQEWYEKCLSAQITRNM